MSIPEKEETSTPPTNREEEEGGEDEVELLAGISSEDCHPTEEEEKEDKSVIQKDTAKPTEDEERFLQENHITTAAESSFTQKEYYNQLPTDVKQVLDKCSGWAITRIQSPQKFIIARKDSNQILRAQIQKEEEYNSNKDKEGEEKKTVFRFRTTDVLINAIPLEVTEHVDPLIKEIGSPSSLEQQQLQHQYTIRFRTTKGECFILSCMSLSEIFRELDDSALVISSYGAEKALNAIVNSFRELDKMQVNRDVRTAGFYLIDGKITMAANAINAIKHPMPTKEQMVECIEFIDNILYEQYFNTRPELLPTFIKWGIMALWILA